MTQSGQEPPDIGRGAAEVSGETTSPKGQVRSRRRRRKRRSGKMRELAQGEASASSAVAGNAQGQADSGQSGAQGATHARLTQERTLAAGEHVRSDHARPGQPPAGQPNSKRKRRKKRRGANGSLTQVEATTSDDGIVVDRGTSRNDRVSTEPGPGNARSARRRGRRAGPAETVPVERGTDPGLVQAAAIPSDAVGDTRKADVHRPASPHVPGRDSNQRPNSKRPQTRSRSSRPAEGEDSDRQLYAALDLGTNNCRLLIARPEHRGFRVVDAYSRIVRLGEGVGANKLLSDAAMDRSIDALANCHRKLAERGVQRSRLIATEACRAAENGAEFIERVQAETGLVLEIVDRETEARLAVAGCVSLVDQEAEGVILFDIGGGSSEIVWLDLRNRCGARGYALTRFIRSWVSLPVGVVNLAERHGGVHVTPEIFEAMVDDVADHLQAFNLGDELTQAICDGDVHMLGTSGTVTTLAGVHFGLKRYDRRRVDGAWMEDSQVSAMIDRLRDMPYEERVDNPCIGADRADLVLAGCAILEAIRRRWTCSRLRVADRGLREGILTELMSADGVWSKRNVNDRNAGRQRGRT